MKLTGMVCAAITAFAVSLMSSCAATRQNEGGSTAPKLAAPAKAGGAVAAGTVRKGSATVVTQRPEHFPHRIWAASDFEVHLPVYGWFGNDENKNIPAYPGNATAQVKRKTQEYAGINPVPGPCMGKFNYMYCRYFIKGTDKAKFQHFNLNVSDNWNINVSGLQQGQWSELTLNFTKNARRNNGSAEVFKEGERMDDLKVFVAANKEEAAKVDLALDDVIFFAEDPALPPEKEPFPRRVIYTAGFDTGVGSEKDQQLFFPGQYQLISKDAPAGAYWAVLQAWPNKINSEQFVVLRMDVQLPPPAPAKGATAPAPPPPAPPLQYRTAGAETKVRFRYFISGTDKIKLVLHDVTENVDRVVDVTGLKQDTWAWQYVNFTKDAKGGVKPLAAGNKIGLIQWIIPGGEKSKLYIDEVTVFDAGQPGGQPLP
jgi:hypothetical protein